MAPRGLSGDLAAIVTGAMVVLAVAAVVVDPMSLAELPAGWDGHVYVAMVDQISPCVEAPFCWRPLVPSVVSALPGSAAFGYAVATWSGIAAMAAGTFMLFRGTFGRQRAAAAAMAALSIPWLTSWLVDYAWLTDAWMFAAVVWATVAALRGRWLAYAAVMTAGVLVKEPTLVAPLLVYAVAATRPVDRRLVARLAAWTAPSVVAAMTIRLALPGEAENTVAYGIRRLVDPTFTDLLNYTVVPWGVALLVLAAVGAATNWRMAVRLAPFAFAVYAQLLVARNDVRLVVLAFPAVLWLALIALQRVQSRAVVAAALALVSVSVLSRPTVEFSLTREVVVAAVALAVGVAAAQSENRLTEKKLRPSASRVVAPPEVNTISS